MEIKKLKCDNCGAEWHNQSSPTDAAYKSSAIKIAEASKMLLPNLNFAYLSGDYCCPDCLTEKMRKLLKNV